MSTKETHLCQHGNVDAFVEAVSQLFRRNVYKKIERSQRVK